MEKEKKTLSLEEREEIIEILKTRFDDNMVRHNGLEWKI